MFLYLLAEQTYLNFGDRMSPMDNCVHDVPCGTVNFTVNRFIKFINSSAFSECSLTLQNVDFSSAVMLTRILAFAFTGCANLHSIDLSKCQQLWLIEQSAFSDCKINTIILPPLLRSIGNFAFSNCNFSDIKIPDTVFMIGKGSFANTPVKNVNIDQKSHLSIIRSQAFYNTKVEIIYLPRNLAKIGSQAFAKTNLFYFRLDPANPYFYFNHAIYSIDKERLIFMPPCMNSDNFELPPETQIIEKYAFLDSKLEKLNLNNVKRICNHAFMNSSIKKLVIPDSVKIIGDYAFAGCSSLKKLRLNGMTINIGKNAFQQTGITCGVHAEPHLIKPLHEAGIPLSAFLSCVKTNRKMHK